MLFISIAALPTCKISAKNIDNCFSYIAKLRYLTFDPLGWVQGDEVKVDTATLIYRHWAIMVYIEKLLNIIDLMKCEDYHTKKLTYRFCIIIAYTKTRALHYKSSVKRSILMKPIGHRESMILIICTKNESNLTNRYWDMIPDWQKVRTDRQTDGWNGRTDAQTEWRMDGQIIDTWTTPKLYHTDFVGG